MKVLWRKQATALKVLYGAYWVKKMLSAVLKIASTHFKEASNKRYENLAWKWGSDNVIIVRLYSNKYCPNLVGSVIYII